MKVKPLRTLCLACLYALFSSSVLAGQVTSSLTSSASVSNTCKINSTQSISLGVYIPSNGVALQSPGQISVSCTKGDTVSILPSSGGSSLMGSGSNLSYGLFIDASTTQPWGSYQYSQKTWDDGNPPPAVYFYQASPTPSNATACATLANGASYFYGNAGASTGCFWGLSLTNATGSLHPVTTISASRTSVYVGSTQILQGTTGNVFKISSGTYVSGTGPTSVWTIPVITGNGQSLSSTSTSVKNPMLLTYYAKVPGSQDVPPGSYTDTVTVELTF